MEDDSTRNVLKWGLGILGLGAIASAVLVPGIGIWVGVAILVLALLLFGGYFLWKRLRARRQSRSFEGAIEAQTSAAPKAISDPNRRAALDKLRQKFQSGLQEFKSRGKDIYKLPWYIIIGEPGSGKTEAIRHSGIDFPPGLQNELQGSGGTINMDWWFTNRGIILDTAGSMIFNESQAGEAPEWGEFLRLLKRARPQCPINGLFLVLSVESLIKDSADKIAQKASRLAQQLDLIQRTLDVRFPVYLLVTKSDLLTGFREFFDNIDDPLLQHQIFGWSDPDPLDAHFRPELVEQHLQTVAERIRLRRLALLREGATSASFSDTSQFFAPAFQSGGVGATRRLDGVDSLFALPESLVRLAPRLRRYLETVFVAGEWSAKPVFLRGIYFTSSMREGRALDEAIALAAGVPLEQLPEDRRWEKNRAFFLRDLFLEKVFHESGLVTRATNTLRLLRKRQLLIFGTATFALLLLLGFAGFSYQSLKRSVLAEAAYWQAGAINWNQGEWSPSIVRSSENGPFRYQYGGTNMVPGLPGVTVVQYQQHLKEIVEKRLPVPWIFKPIAWMIPGKDLKRPDAQREMFEGGVLRPLVWGTWAKMEQPGTPTGGAVGQQHDALLALMHLQADQLEGPDANSMAGTNATSSASKDLAAFLSYLMETNQPADTNLAEVFAWTYARNGGQGQWPPGSIIQGDTLSNTPAISNGLVIFQQANLNAQTNINQDLANLDNLVDRMWEYQTNELAWLVNDQDPCASLTNNLWPRKQIVEESLLALRRFTNVTTSPLTNLETRYALLQRNASDVSISSFNNILTNIPDAYKDRGLFKEIIAELSRFRQDAGGAVASHFIERSNWVVAVDKDELAVIGGRPALDVRWDLYLSACALAQESIIVNEQVVGSEWEGYIELKGITDQYRTNLMAYNGLLADLASNACEKIARRAEQQSRDDFVAGYIRFTTNQLSIYDTHTQWSLASITNAGAFFAKVKLDLDHSDVLGAEANKLDSLKGSLAESKNHALQSIDTYVHGLLKFPVLLTANPSDAMTIADLVNLKKLLVGLTQELQKSVWQTGSSESLGRLQTNLDRCNSVVSSLINADNTPAQWTISFLPPQEGSTNWTILTVFRAVQVTIGQSESGWQDLTGKNTPFSFGKGSVDLNLTISFRKQANDPSSELDPVKLDRWSLIRLINGEKGITVERSSNGEKWTISIPLDDPQTQVSGGAVFEVDVGQPLPKLEDWPK